MTQTLLFPTSLLPVAVSDPSAMDKQFVDSLLIASELPVSSFLDMRGKPKVFDPNLLMKV